MKQVNKGKRKIEDKDTKTNIKFITLYQQHIRWLLLYSKSKFRSIEDQKDYQQEAWILVWKMWKKFKKDKTLIDLLKLSKLTSFWAYKNFINKDRHKHTIISGKTYKGGDKILETELSLPRDKNNKFSNYLDEIYFKLLDNNGFKQVEKDILLKELGSIFSKKEKKKRVVFNSRVKGVGFREISKLLNYKSPASSYQIYKKILKRLKDFAD